MLENKLSYHELQQKHEEIQDAINKVKKFTVTTINKKSHMSKVWEFIDLINDLSHINPYIIHEDDLTGFIWYKKLVYNKYNETTKKELDQKLRFAKTDLINTLIRIFEYMTE